MLPKNGSEVAAITSTVFGQEQNQLGEFNPSTFFWALNQKGFNVYVKKQDGHCDFLKLACNKCTTREGCNCELDNAKPKIIVNDMKFFVSLLVNLYELIKENKNIPWLRKNSVLSIFNNATLYDLEHPEEFLRNIIAMIKNSELIETDRVKNLGTLNMSRGNFELYFRVENVSASQEAPQAFITNLSRDGLVMQENELHRIRFGVISNDTVVVTSIQTEMIRYSKLTIKHKVQVIYNSLYDILNASQNLGRFIPENIKVLLKRFEELNQGEEADLDLLDEKVLELLKYAVENLPICLIHQPKVLPIMKAAYDKYLACVRNFITISQDLGGLTSALDSYKAREDNIKCLNPEMRMKSNGHLSGENGSCFAMTLFVEYIKSLGLSKIKIPISFPIRDAMRLETTTSYIADKKAKLVERLKIELGLDESTIQVVDDGNAFLIDVSNMNIGRPILQNVASRIQQSSAEF